MTSTIYVFISKYLYSTIDPHGFQGWFSRPSDAATDDVGICSIFVLDSTINFTNDAVDVIIDVVADALGISFYGTITNALGI
jgi:hypothetical protein